MILICIKAAHYFITNLELERWCLLYSKSKNKNFAKKLININLHIYYVVVGLPLGCIDVIPRCSICLTWVNMVFHKLGLR